MNKIFKVIWNNAKHCYVVASELAKGYSRGGGSRTIRRAMVTLGVVAAVYVAAGSVLAANSGGHLDGNNYIGDSPYNVTVDSDVNGYVYGHKENSEKVEEASVTMTGGTVNLAVGGYSNLDEALNNSVNISDVTIGYDVYGGYSPSVNAASNSVSINGETTVRDVFGGFSQFGKAVSNSVNISSGTVNWAIGGYSDLDEVQNNSANISDGTITIVYGGWVESGSDSGNVTSNSVNISSGSIQIVYGGKTYIGTAASNLVNIRGGAIGENVYGGYVASASGDVASNSVNISGGTIGSIDNNGDLQGGSVYGGFVNSETGSGEAVSNYITISGDSTSIKSSVWGGHVEQGSGDAASNSVNISGGTIGSINDAGEVQGGGVTGGYIFYGSGDVASNSVNISGGHVLDSVYGGCIEGESVYDNVSGNVFSNSVNISGSSTIIGGSVYGGCNGNTDTGAVIKNSINISGGTIEKNVYGGFSSSCNVANNSVIICGGTVNKNVFGGNTYDGKVDSNYVNISGGTVNNSVYGGYSSLCVVASNVVNISSGTVNQDVYGGFAITGYGNPVGNLVNISGVSTLIKGSVYGGYVEDGIGSASYNIVNISNGTVNNSVFGGYSYSGDTASNSVNINGGTFGSESKIYAGYVKEPNNSKISDNVVNLGGTVTGLNNVEIYGCYFENGSGTNSDNELHIGRTVDYDDESKIKRDTDGNIIYKSNESTIWQGKTSDDSINNKVKTVANFETIALHSVAWSETLPALAAESFKYDNSTALGGNVTLDITSLTFDKDNASGSMTLLQSDTEENFSGIKLKYSDSEDAAIIPDSGIVVRFDTDQTLQSNGIEYTYDYEQKASRTDSDKKVNLTGLNIYKKLELGSMKLSDGGYTFSNTDSISSNVLELSIGTDFNIDGSETLDDDTQFILIDLSQTAGSLKDAIDTTKIVETQKNITSEMTFEIAREDSIKSDSEKKKVIYIVGKCKDVTKVVFNSSKDWNSEKPYYSNTSFDFTNANKIDASELKFRFTNDQLAELSDSSVMTLVSNASNQPEDAEVTYKNDATNHSQEIDYVTDNGAVLSGTMTGVINTSDSAIKFDISQITLDSISLDEWDGAKEASALLEGWSANPDGVNITAANFDPTVTTGEKTILTASTNVFKDENIDESIRYAEGAFNNALENGVSHSGTQTGGVKATDEGKALTYYAMKKIIDKFDLADWDGENAVSAPTNWIVNDGASIETDSMSKLPESDEEKQVFILKSDKEGFFANVAINGENIYGKNQNKFTDSDEAERVVLTGTQERGVAFDSAKTNLVYKLGSKDVATFKLNTIAWEDGAELLCRDKYNYSKLTTLDTNDFNITYEKPETITVNQSMILLKANETLADMAALEKSVTYQYEPLSGVTMDAVIRSSLEAKSGKVTLTAVSNKADKLTFGNVEWLDKGSLIDHKTMLSNVSFDGADVDTTKIAFTNKQKLDADMQMTLVSDFGDSVGTITGGKYKVGTAYEGEGSAYLDGSNLVFKTKTSAGISEQTHTTVMAMEAGIAALAAGNDYIGTVMEGLGMTANKGSDGVSTAASFGGGASRYETGSHVDTNSWNIAVAVGKNLEKKDGTLEYGLFGEYGRGNYTLHMNGIEDAGSGNTHYTGGGLLLKWTNSHDVYTEASFRMGSMKDKASSLLHDGAGNAYGYDTSSKYRGGHFGIGKICREVGGTKLDIYGKYFYNEREGINFAAGADQYSLDEVRSRVLRAGFRYSTTQRKWNRYGGIAYDYEFGGESTGTVNGTPIRSASVKGGTLRGEFGYCREATKTNPWKTDISLYGFTGKRNGFGGSIAVEYHF